LPQASLITPVAAPRSGYLAGLNAAEVGKTGLELGGGRQKKGDVIDYAVGIECHAKISDFVQTGQPLFTVHANDPAKLVAAQTRLLAAVTWSDHPVPAPPHTLKIIE
jgi:thymidine phosphorylase